MVDSFKGRKSGERSLESKDSCRGIGKLIGKSCCLVLRDQEMVTRYCGGIAQLGERLNGIQEVSGSIPLTSTNLIEVHHDTKFEVRKDFDSSVREPGNS